MMTCVHEYDVTGVSGDMDMFPLSTFTSESWSGSYVCVHLEFRKVVSLVLRARCLVERSRASWKLMDGVISI